MKNELKSPLRIQMESNRIRRAHPSTRMGQSLMLALSTYHPEFERTLTGTDADCFYNNKNIPAFWDAVNAWMAE